MLDDFETLDFPTPETLSSFSGPAGGYVYVIAWSLRDGPSIPLYVGETDRLWGGFGRMSDYCTAQFHAPTDFHVGEAVRYLRDNKTCRIMLLFKKASDDRKDRRKYEHRLTRELQASGVRLMNGLARHNYKSDEVKAERQFIQQLCDSLISDFSK
jgi:hypothetical protein